MVEVAALVANPGLLPGFQKLWPLLAIEGQSTANAKAAANNEQAASNVPTKTANKAQQAKYHDANKDSGALLGWWSGFFCHGGL